MYKRFFSLVFLLSVSSIDISAEAPVNPASENQVNQADSQEVKQENKTENPNKFFKLESMLNSDESMKALYNSLSQEDKNQFENILNDLDKVVPEVASMVNDLSMKYMNIIVKYKAFKKIDNLNFGLVFSINEKTKSLKDEADKSDNYLNEDAKAFYDSLSTEEEKAEAMKMLEEMKILCSHATQKMAEVINSDINSTFKENIANISNGESVFTVKAEFENPFPSSFSLLG